MFCTSCHNEVPANLRYCPNCEAAPFRIPVKPLVLGLIVLLVAVGAPVAIHRHNIATQRTHFQHLLDSAGQQSKTYITDWANYAALSDEATAAGKKRNGSTSAVRTDIALTNNAGS